MWSYRPLIWISIFLRCINLPNVNPFVDVKSQLISGETWSWPVGASSARAARSTRARSCRRTRSCTVQTASGVCRVRSHRSASLPILLFASVSQSRVLTSHYFYVVYPTASDSTARLPDEDPSQLPPHEEDGQRQQHACEELRTETFPSTCTCVTLLSLWYLWHWTWPSHTLDFITSEHAWLLLALHFHFQINIWTTHHIFWTRNSNFFGAIFLLINYNHIYL